jgi:hypothetical protein
MLEPCVPCGSHVGARWCHMGGNCHQMGAAWLPNGGHMGVVCAYGSWMEPFGRHVGAASTRWEPHEPYGSHMQHTGPYGLCVQRWMAPLWDLHALHGGHWVAKCAEWELCAPFWSQVEPYGRWLLPYGSCAHHTGHMRAMCHIALHGSHMGAGTVWEPRAPYGSQMEPHASWMVPYMSWQIGAICALWELYGSCECHMG